MASCNYLIITLITHLICSVRILASSFTTCEEQSDDGTNKKEEEGKRNKKEKIKA
jgi:hypothetical protein